MRRAPKPQKFERQPAPSTTPPPSALDKWAWPAAAAASLVALAVLSVFPVQSDDVFMYLAIGRRIVEQRAFPKIDPFLYSIPDYHWHVLHEWAAHLLTYTIYKLTGWTGLIIAKTLMVLAMASVALWTARRLALRSFLVPLFVLLAGLASYHRLIERSSMISDLFTALVAAILIVSRSTDAPRDARLVYALPALFLFWTNLHPGFFAGLALCAIALACDVLRWRTPAFRRLAICSALSVLACMFNPDGIAGFFYPLRPIFDRTWDIYRQFNFEWMPTLSPAYRDTMDVKCFITIIVITVFLALTALPRRPWFEILAAAMLVWMGFSAIRFLPTAAFALAVIATSLAAKSALRTLPAPASLPAALNGITALACALFALGLFFRPLPTLAATRRPGFGLDDRMHPAAAADLIDQIGVETNLFNDHSFGSYLAWRWDGKRKLYYHGFVDDLNFYRHNFLAVSESPEQFQRIVDTYQIGAFLLTPPPRGGLPLVYQMLFNTPQWRLVHSDGRAILFLRDIPANQPALARCAPPPPR